MKPWHIHTEKKPTDAFTIPLWASFKPSDFYFATSMSEGVVIVHIVPEEYWNNNHRTFYDSMPIVQHLPNYLQEIFEGGYEAEVGMPLTGITEDLLKRGFIHNHFFQQFIDRDGIH